MTTGQAATDAFAFLIDNLPPRVVVAATSRTDPALPLARLRARGELVDLASEREDVVLYWHHWQVQSPVMARLAQAIGDAARSALQA